MRPSSAISAAPGIIGNSSVERLGLAVQNSQLISLDTPHSPPQEVPHQTKGTGQRLCCPVPLSGIRPDNIGELRGRSACCLCGLTYAGKWGFDLINSAKHEVEAEYANDENSACDQEIGGKASAISHDTCDDRGNDAGHVTQEVHNAANRADS